MGQFFFNPHSSVYQKHPEMQDNTVWDRISFVTPMSRWFSYAAQTGRFKEDDMRANVFAALLIGLMLALVACPGGETNPPPPPDPPVPPITTDFGTPVGSPVEGTMDANGGSVTEPTAAVTVRAVPGVYDSSATVSVQPITNTLPGGLGMGAAITSSQTLKKPLIVRFSYAADDVDPDTLGIALQGENGSWVSLYPMMVNTTNKTIAVALPDSLSATTASAQVKPMGLDLKRVVKYKAFYMKPASATVGVGQNVTFTPWARVVENQCKTIHSSVGGSPVRALSDFVEDDLAPLPTCKKAVVKEYPFTNIKADFVRTWAVNGVENGNASFGTIQPQSPAGAIYTAPVTVPNPNTVDVRFTSSFSDKDYPPVVLTANVTIKPAGGAWSGTVTYTVAGTRTVNDSGTNPGTGGNYTRTTVYTVNGEGNLSFTEGMTPGVFAVTGGAGSYTYRREENFQSTYHGYPGCLYTTTQKQEETLSGSTTLAAGDPAYPIFFSFNDFDGTYSLIFGTLKGKTAGQVHTVGTGTATPEKDGLKCSVTPTDTTIPLEGRFSEISVSETGTIDPKNPDTIKGSKTIVEGWLPPLTWTISWNLSRQ